MTTRDYAEAYEDDSAPVRAWPAQDAQEPDHHEAWVASLEAEIVQLKKDAAHTMSWYKTVCDLLTEHTAERDEARAERDTLLEYLVDVAAALGVPA